MSNLKENEFVSKFNGEEVTLRTIPLNSRIKREAEKYANQAFQEAVANKFILAVQADQILRESGYDFAKEQKELEALQNEYKVLEKALLTGRKDGYKLTKLEGRAIALQIRDLRSKMVDVSSTRQGLFNRTADKQADNERLQYYVYACTLDAKNNRPFFKTFEESKENADSDLMIDATRNFLKVVIGFDNEAEKQLVENKWLIKYNFMNDQMKLINKDGHLVDDEMRLINEDGRFIDKDGNFVDIDGNKVDKDGNMIVDETDIYNE